MSNLLTILAAAIMVSGAVLLFAQGDSRAASSLFQIEGGNLSSGHFASFRLNTETGAMSFCTPEWCRPINESNVPMGSP